MDGAPNLSPAERYDLYLVTSAGDEVSHRSVKVVRAFRPLMADFLLHEWDGRDVVTLGRVALMWFHLDAPNLATRQFLRNKCPHQSLH